MEAYLKVISDGLPCREKQLVQLYNYLGESDEPTPASIYVFGNTATGKTSAVTSTLEYLDYRYVTVNAIECYAPKILYEAILNTLAGHVYNEDNKYCPLYKCDNMKEFVAALNGEEFLARNGEYEPVVIVVDKAEHLRDMDANILPIFLRLREFCPRLNVCTMLISDIPFEKFYPKNGLQEPLKIFFPQYSKDELYKIIFATQPSCANFVLSQMKTIDLTIREAILSPDLFANYLNVFLSVFYRPCRDLVELRHMARVNFMKYCEPIVDGSVKSEDMTKLWRHIAPVLKTSLETLYLRIQPNANFVSNREDPLTRDIEMRMERLGIQKTNVTKMTNLAEELTSNKVWAQSFELPFYAKFLLIASYLASYNSAKEDKRLFMKYHGKQRKRLQQVNAKAKISDRLNEQLGPKYFTLDRLLAIFYSILEERAGLTANLLCQVPALVALRLLQSSSTASIDNTRYRCIAPAGLVIAVSASLGFNIRKYLYDYI